MFGVAAADDDIRKHPHWKLDIELWDFIGIWDLDIGHSTKELTRVFFLLGIWNGLGEIRAHKLRSSLTITCVLLGVASLVLIAGFITGLFQEWDVFQQEMGWAEKQAEAERIKAESEAQGHL